MKTIVIMFSIMVFVVGISYAEESSPYTKGVDIIEELEAQKNCDDIWAMRTLFVSVLFDLTTTRDININTLHALSDKQFTEMNKPPRDRYTTCLDIVVDFRDRCRQIEGRQDLNSEQRNAAIQDVLSELRKIASMFDAAHRETCNK